MPSSSQLCAHRVVIVWGNVNYGILLDDFKGHSTAMVKDYTKGFRINNDEYDLFVFDITEGRINPVS